MPGQIVNISWKEAVSETALKCGDPFFKDFPKHIYSQAVYRAERGIAKDYKIMDRVLTITNTAGDSEIDIARLNFNGEWRVAITKPAADDESTPQTYTYTRVQYEDLDDVTSSTLPDYRYTINYIGNRYVFRYNNVDANDEINIYYVSSIAGEEDYEYYDDEGNVNLIPVLPNKFYEETVRRAVVYIAEIGIATFDGLKAKRYARILSRYTRPKDVMEEQGLERNRPWIQIRAFSTVFPGD